MTIPELETAFEKRFPVIHACHNTATPGEYFYSFVSAIIKRSSDDEIIIQAEVKNVTHNAVAIVNPEELRYATPEEFTNYNKKIKEQKNEKGDALLELET